MSVQHPSHFSVDHILLPPQGALAGAHLLWTRLAWLCPQAVTEKRHKRLCLCPAFAGSGLGGLDGVWARSEQKEDTLPAPVPSMAKSQPGSSILQLLAPADRRLEGNGASLLCRPGPASPFSLPSASRSQPANYGGREALMARGLHSSPSPAAADSHQLVGRWGWLQQPPMRHAGVLPTCLPWPVQGGAKLPSIPPMTDVCSIYSCSNL